MRSTVRTARPGATRRSLFVAPGVGASVPAAMSRTPPHSSHTAWWCGSVLGSNRAASPRLPGRRTVPARPVRASVSSVLYTVAKLIEGKSGRSRSNRSCAVGCEVSPAKRRTIAIRWGVSFSPARLRSRSIVLASCPWSGGPSTRTKLTRIIPRCKPLQTWLAPGLSIGPGPDRKQANDFVGGRRRVAAALSVLALAPAENGQLEVVELADGGLLGDVDRAHLSRPRAAHQLAGFVELACLGSLQLPARSLRKGARRQRHHVVEGQTHALLDGSTDFGHQGRCLANSLGLLHLERQPDPLAAPLDAARGTRSEGHDVAAAHAGDLARLPLHVLRVVVAPVDDHELLAAPADEHVTALDEAEVARLQEPAREGRVRPLRVFPVAAHDARAGHAELTDDALGQGPLARRVLRVEDPDRVLGELGPARHE